jgi:hypothetical protein
MTADPATVINPAVIPAGTELFFGYSNRVHAVLHQPHLHQLVHPQQ